MCGDEMGGGKPSYPKTVVGGLGYNDISIHIPIPLPTYIAIYINFTQYIYIYVFIYLHLLSSLLAPVQGRRDGKQGKKKEYIYLKREKDDVNRGGRGREKREGRDFKMTREMGECRK